MCWASKDPEGHEAAGGGDVKHVSDAKAAEDNTSDIAKQVRATQDRNRMVCFILEHKICAGVRGPYITITCYASRSARYCCVNVLIVFVIAGRRPQAMTGATCRRT